MAIGMPSRASMPLNTINIRPAHPPHVTLARKIALALLALMVLAGLLGLITWLLIRPTKLVFSIDEASIHDYNLGNSKLNSTFDFTIRAYNPNNKILVYYGTMQVSVSYQGQLMATRGMDPFFQGYKDVTRFRSEAVANNVGLGGPRERALKRERTRGAVNLNVGIKGKIRFRVGWWKSGHYKLKVGCSPLVVFSDPKRFRPTKCDVDI